MKIQIGLARVPSLFASLFLLLAMTVVFPQLASAQCSDGSGLAAPLHLRVDRADGATGELFVTWDPPDSKAPYTYNVCRSLSSGSGYQSVSYCSDTTAATQSNPQYSLTTTGGQLICRDDNGVLAGLSTSPLTTSPPTTYYYKVQTCAASPLGSNCGPFTSVTSTSSNIPVSCNCTSTQIPNMQGVVNSAHPHVYSFDTPSDNTVDLFDVIPSTLDPNPYPCKIENPNSCSGVGHNECRNAVSGSCDEVKQHYSYYNYKNASVGHQGKLVVSLPGSGSAGCGRGQLASTAQNLGFDILCVDYDNHSQQEGICNQGNVSSPGSVANCFSAITQAKLNWQSMVVPAGDLYLLIDCTSSNGANVQDCGQDSHGPGDGKTGNYYYVNSVYDAVIPRLTMMLYYLYCHADTPQTQWESYLTVTGQQQPCANGQTAAILANYSPNWSKIVLSGFSQGGVMSTFASYENPVSRVVNLSAPPDADLVTSPTGDTQVAASFYTFLNSGNGPINGISSIYGLVSANDYLRYCTRGDDKNGNVNQSIYTAVWNAMGFGQEQDFNWNGLTQPCTSYGGPIPPPLPNQVSSLSCPASDHNFVNWGVVNHGGTGHDDTLYIWNEHFYEFMLTQ